jgi:hypothetical protein
MKVVYCANCGTALPIKRKAMPKYGMIVDLVQHHTCTEDAQFNFTPNPVPAYVDKTKEKFVQILNELQPPSLTTEDLRDRREAAFVKSDIDSTAPVGVLDQMKGMKED